jgi:hypothetical protein
MDFLRFGEITFDADGNIGSLCENLTDIIGHGIWYDTFRPQNTKWLSLVTDIVTSLNNESVMCGSFGYYPAFIAGVLNSTDTIHFYVLCNKRPDYINIILNSLMKNEKCRFRLKPLINNYFLVSCDGAEVTIIFQEIISTKKLPSALTFAHGVLNKIQLSSLTYAIISLNERVTCITNEVLTSRHDCEFAILPSDLDKPKRLANCKLYSDLCAAYNQYPFYAEISYCTKKSHHLSWQPKCYCTLCVKKGPASLKSLCVNKLAEIKTHNSASYKCNSKVCKML